MRKGAAEYKDDGGIIRAFPERYELSSASVLNLGRLYSSLDIAGQGQLIAMAAHQMRRESPFCEYTPQLFAFLAKYFDFGRAFETVLEYLKFDELGWYSLLGVSEFIAHDYPLISDAILETERKKLIEKLKQLENATYEKWNALAHDGGRGSEYVAYWRAKNVAMKISQQTTAVRRLRLEKGLADSPVQREPMVHSTFKTGDAVLDNLLQSAQTKFLTGDVVLRKEASYFARQGYGRACFPSEFRK